MTKEVKLNDEIVFGATRKLVFIAGPCVIESREICFEIARSLLNTSKNLQLPIVFKASFDKANRTSIDSFRGVGIEKGLEILKSVKETFGLPIITDIHEPSQAKAVAEVADIIQIPAFLCRQTDLLLAAGDTGAIVNVKKGQFLAAEDMWNIITKLESTGNKRILLTERGTSFGYHNLVVDMRNLMIMHNLGYPVIFDATHSVQRPGGAGKCSGGDSCYVPGLARSAVACGCDGVFFETHPRPEEALSDKANAIKLSDLENLFKSLEQFHNLSILSRFSKDEIKGAKR